jgi:hypothetical protein
MFFVIFLVHHPYQIQNDLGHSKSNIQRRIRKSSMKNLRLKFVHVQIHFVVVEYQSSLILKISVVLVRTKTKIDQI